MKCYWGLRSDGKELGAGPVIPMESLENLCFSLLLKCFWNYFQCFFNCNLRYIIFLAFWLRAISSIQAGRLSSVLLVVFEKLAFAFCFQMLTGLCNKYCVALVGCFLCFCICRACHNIELTNCVNQLLYASNLVLFVTLNVFLSVHLDLLYTLAVYLLKVNFQIWVICSVKGTVLHLLTVVSELSLGCVKFLTVEFFSTYDFYIHNFVQDFNLLNGRRV